MVNETDKCDSCKKINQALYLFSCKHKTCQQCLMTNFVLSNLSGMTLNQILINCPTCLKGQLATDVPSMINILNSALPLKNKQSTVMTESVKSPYSLCSKHAIIVESFCKTCRLWLCSECKEQYHTVYYPNHILLSKEEEESNLSCVNHFDGQIDTYCLLCQVCICKKCLMKSEPHFNHRHVPIEDKPQAKKKTKPNTVLNNYQSYNEFLQFIEANEKTFFEKMENDYIIQQKKVQEFVNNLQLMINDYSNQMQAFQNDMRNLYQLIKLSYQSYFDLLENKTNSSHNANMKKTYAFSKYITDIALITQKTIDIDNMNFALMNANKEKINRLDYKIIWNNNEIEQKEKIECHQEGVTRIVELKRYNGFATCSSDASIKIWKYNSDNDVVDEDNQPIINQEVSKTKENNVLVQQSANIPLVKTLPGILKHMETLSGHKSSIWTLLECKDGILVSGSSDKTIKLWAVEGGTNIGSLIGHKDTVYALTELNNSLIASGSEDRTIRIWNRKENKCITVLSGHNGKITSLTVLLDNCLISGSDDNSLMLWSINEGTSIGKLIGHGCTVWCSLAFDDGITIASGSSDNLIKLWDLNQMKCISTFEGHENTISHLILLSNGYLASVSWDASIKFWDLNTTLCVFSIKVHSDIIWDIVETREGQIITASNDKSIIIWESK